MTPPHSNSSARPRRPLARLALAAATCGLVFGVAEVALRLFAPLHLVGFPGAYEFDAELGVRAKPGVHALRTTDHQQELRVNRLGTINFQEDFSGYPIRLFALGDSYTQGTGLPADAAYPFQLDLLLNRDAAGRYERRVAVINLGLAANGGEQSLLILRRFSEQLGQPHLVLYLGAENDASDDAMFLRGDRHRHLTDGNPRWGAMLPVIRWAAETEIGKRLRLALNRKAVVGARPSGRRNAAGPGDARVTELPLRTPPTVRTTADVGVDAGAADGRTLLRPEGRAPIAATEPAGAGFALSVAEQQRSVFERMKTQCRDKKTTLVVSWAAAPSASYDWLKTWAATNDVVFADWLPGVESVRGHIPDLPLNNPHSGGHLRPWVNRVIAEEFARQVAASKGATLK